jgi:hypothetical protein
MIKCKHKRNITRLWNEIETNIQNIEDNGDPTSMYPFGDLAQGRFYGCFHVPTIREAF